ncbi:hypothetical protein QBC40DRAFT_301855 [Triangularia verruculosa]|uniref:Uncharacterized protein n=1 Tax=Triangularia verruculosa TaxID=2587418 RepID=A0AAN6X6C9_9PEZI|nr:hypothetical protein QBC40DRAFT_301855 [Triangularia verruculosa]
MGLKRDARGTLSPRSTPPDLAGGATTSLSLWTMFTDRILEQAWSLPATLEHIANVWLPLILEAAFHEIQFPCVVREVGSYRPVPNELVQRVRQKHKQVAGTLLKSLCIRTVGLGCQAEKRANELDELMYEKGVDFEVREELLGHELYMALCNGPLGPVLARMGLSGKCLVDYKSQLPGAPKLVKKRKRAVWYSTWDLSLR